MTDCKYDKTLNVGKRNINEYEYITQQNLWILKIIF